MGAVHDGNDHCVDLPPPNKKCTSNEDYHGCPIVRMESIPHFPHVKFGCSPHRVPRTARIIIQWVNGDFQLEVSKPGSKMQLSHVDRS
jgi:hypothetical protein